MKKISFLTVALWISTMPLFAEIKLPALVGDNMVLQQSTQVRLWGEATPNTTLTAYGSWSQQTYTTQVDGQGKWEIWVQTPSASFDKQQVTLENEADKITLHDILIGEVWLGGGQSNMEMPLRGFTQCPIGGSDYVIATAGRYKNAIRYATIDRVGALEPAEYPQGGEWKVCNSANAPEFGATAYFFAIMLVDVLDVPVGIINCSWGGSSVEGWLPKEILKGYSDVDLSQAGDENIHPMLQPMIMYNGLLKPTSKYTIKGFLWYQGESNVGHPDYAKRLATMVEEWRSLWGQGELPFYMVEIAPYGDYGEEDKGAFLREEQHKATKLIPNSGIISTNDLVEDYEIYQIHPRNKQTVGERLCYMALNKTYGYKTIPCEGPEYDHMEIDGDKALVYFNHAKDGFNLLSDMIGFEIAGEDMVFHEANATIHNSPYDYEHANVLIVSSPEVEKPVAVRYCFHDFQIGNVKNVQGMPMLPFRTDTE